jgi:hypothetical protein
MRAGIVGLEREIVVKLIVPARADRKSSYILTCNMPELEKLDITSLIRLNFNLFSNGLILESGIVRELARKKTLNEISLLRGQDRFDGAFNEEYFESCQIKNVNNSIKHLKEWGPRLIGQKRAEVDSIYSSSELERLIKSKRIAIVGPNRDKDEALLKELASYDVVVLNNVIVADDFLLELRKNSLIVSYYNEFHSKYLYINNKFDIFKHLDFSVFRAYKFKYQLELYFENKAKLAMLNRAFFNGVMQGF